MSSPEQPTSERRVFRINPEIIKGVIHWRTYCAAILTTEECIAYRDRVHGTSAVCGRSAKVSYDGTNLCLQHAGARALADALGEMT